MKPKANVILVAILLVCVLILGNTVTAADKKKVDILWSQYYPAQAKAIQKMAKEYSDSHPNVKVVPQILTWEKTLEKLSSSMAVGDPPELAALMTSQINTLYARGWLNPLTEVVDSLGGDKYFMKSPGYVEIEGEHWMVPVGTIPLKLTYRRDLLEEAGMEEPRTWDELLKAAEAMTADTNGDGEIDRYGISFCCNRSYCPATFFLSLLWSNGGNVLDEKGNVVFDSEETVETLKFLKELVQYTPPGAPNSGWADAVDNYSTGTVGIAMYSELRPLVVAYNRNPEIAENTDIMPIPTRTPKEESQARWTTMGWVLLKNSPDQEAAKKFVEWFMEPDRLIEYYHSITGGVLTAPAEIPVLESEKLWDHKLYKKFRPIVEEFSSYTNNSVIPSFEHPKILHASIAVFMNDLTITDMIQSVLFGNKSPSEAVEKAAKEMRDYLETHEP